MPDALVVLQSSARNATPPTYPEFDSTHKINIKQL